MTKRRRLARLLVSMLVGAMIIVGGAAEFAYATGKKTDIVDGDLFKPPKRLEPPVVTRKIEPNTPKHKEPSHKPSGSETHTLQNTQPSTASPPLRPSPAITSAPTTTVAKTAMGLRSYRGLHGNRARIDEQRAILNVAFTRSGFYGLGTATKREANDMGRAFVGPGATRGTKGYLMSADGLRQYRPPRYKVTEGKVQANFDRRSTPQENFKNGANGHLDIVF